MSLYIYEKIRPPPLRPATEFTEVQKITPCPGIGKKEIMDVQKYMTGARTYKKYPLLRNRKNGFIDLGKYDGPPSAQQMSLQMSEKITLAKELEMSLRMSTKMWQGPLRRANEFTGRSNK